MIGYLDKAIRPLVSIMPKMREYVKTFKVKDEDKDKKNKLMFFRIDDEKLLQKYKAISTKIEDLKNIKLNSIPVYDNGYIKTKVRTYGDKFCTNFRGLNVADDYIECEFFTVIFIDSLHVDENKNYVQVYLDNCAYSTILAWSNNSKECMICHYWIFNHGFKFQDSARNGCHDLKTLSVNISDIASITVKNVDYCGIIHNISKFEAINLLKNSVLEDRGYI